MQIVSGDQQSATVGTELATPLQVQVLDSAGVAIAGQIVNFRIVAGGGSVFAGAALTNSAGMAQERWTLGTIAADSQRVEARAVDSETGAALTLAVFRATAVAGSVTTIARVGGDQQLGVLGAVLADSVAVRLADTYGNPVAGDSVALTATAANGALSPARTGSCLKSSPWGVR